ncbi:MAG TPA: PilN domain-containing protein [Gemmatimonadales bacterium]|jgi:hypothetical protein
MVHRPEFGVALGADYLLVVDRQTGEERRAELAPFSGESSWPALAAAFQQLVSSATLAIVLLPPLAEVRQLTLPPLDNDELVQLLTRNALSYFSTARGPQMIGVASGRARRGQPQMVVALAAPAALIAAIHAAARAAECQVALITCPEAAWSAAAQQLSPALRRGTVQLIVAAADRLTVVALYAGEVSGLRRLRGGVADAGRVAELLRAGDRVALLGAGAEGVTDLATRLGATVTPIPAPGVTAERLAARFAGAAAGPSLRSERVVLAERALLRRATGLLAAAAVALIVLAAALQLWGVHRALRQVQGERLALRPQVATTLVGRSSTEDAFRRMAAIAAAERTAPRWSIVLGDLTDRVPDDAYFTTLRARGDTLTIDGIAVSAAKVFDAIVASPMLAGVYAPAPVRRLSPEGGAPTERFTLAGELRDSVPHGPVRRPGASR